VDGPTGNVLAPKSACRGEKGHPDPAKVVGNIFNADQGCMSPDSKSVAHFLLRKNSPLAHYSDGHNEVAESPAVCAGEDMLIRLWVISMLAGVIGAGQTPLPQEKSKTEPGKPSTPAKRTPELRKPMTATLTGKVFAITIGGDLKPSRMASVFVLSGDAVAQFKSTMLSENSKVAEADSQLEDPKLDVLFKENPGLLTSMKRIPCWDAFTNILAEAIKLAENSADSVVTSESDEEGLFKVAGLKPGVCTIVIIGGAGANDGVWVQDVTLEAGQETPIKMHRPSMACSNI